VAQPAEECERLCGFLGVPFDEHMLRFHEGRVRHQPQLDAKKAWRPVTAGLRSWRSDMAPEDLARFEAAAGELLEELGYELGAGDLPPEFREQARRLRSVFESELRDRRNRRLPAGRPG
jgi:hypothetical protein